MGNIPVSSDYLPYFLSGSFLFFFRMEEYLGVVRVKRL